MNSDPFPAFNRLVLACVVGCLSTLPGRAEESFSLSTRAIEIPERGKVNSTVLRGQHHELVFLAPAGWRAENDLKNGAITWTAPDFTTTLRLRVSIQGSGQPQLRPEELRQVVLQELPAAKIIEEFTCPSGANGNGVAFDLQRVVSNQVPFSSRMAFIPFKGGRADVHLSTPTDQFSRRQVELTAFLNSFRVNWTPAP